MPSLNPMPDRSWRYVVRLTGKSPPMATDVARIWTPDGSPQPGCNKGMASEIEEWLAARHPGFRAALELPIRARRVLFDIFGHMDFGPSDVGPYEANRLGRTPGCGPTTIADVEAWMRRRGIKLAWTGRELGERGAFHDLALPVELRLALGAIPGEADATDRIAGLLAAAWEQMYPDQRSNFMASKAVSLLLGLGPVSMPTPPMRETDRPLDAR